MLFRPLALLLFLPLFSNAQETVSMRDMSFWKTSTQNNWQVAGDVNADLNTKEAMKISPGTGVLVNLPNEKNKANLQSVAEFGDVDVSFDFMMASHSNSGFYLQGRYEIQLLDSWGAKNPRYGDCGGIYGRRRFVPKTEMYEGHAPRQNACLAPGLWQHIEIAFQAPRFDAAGKKTANARILRIKLNGTLLHENVELTGPTGGPISEEEAATGPFMIQGDHGPVAFRNIVVTKRSGQPVGISPINYSVWYGKFREASEFVNLKPEATGTIEKLTWKVSNKEDEYALKYNANLLVPKAGNYKLICQLGGRSVVRVNGKELLADAWVFSGDRREATTELPAGSVPIEITVTKSDNWMPPIVGLWIEGPDTRATEYHEFNSVLALPAPDPIYLDAKEPTVFRSFMDIERKDGAWSNNKHRVVHAVNVGDPKELHYSYDLDNGALFQVWKGEFLFNSPMWDNRGDGSSRPRGTLLPLEDGPTVALSATSTDGDPGKSGDATTLERMREKTNFRPLGYDLDPEGHPIFRYQIYGATVTDQILVQDGGKYLTRTLKFTNLPTDNTLLCRLATGSSITALDKTTWLVDDKRYYIQFPADKPQPRVENINGKSVLTVPAAAEVSYSILW